jgi:hypothetical protein
MICGVNAANDVHHVRQSLAAETLDIPTKSQWSEPVMCSFPAEGFLQITRKYERKTVEMGRDNPGVITGD